MTRMQAQLHRLNHAHYWLNSLLCLPLPLALTVSLPLSPTLSSAILAAPVVLALTAAARRRSDNIETLHATITSQIRLFNFCGLAFTAKQIGLSAYWIVAYVAAWFAVSFFFPQPPYLGPHKLRTLTGDEFESEVLLLPPASTFQSDATGKAPRIVELPASSPSSSTPPAGSAPAAPSKDTFHLTLFHADYSSKSRDLQYSLAYLSNLYSSPSLRFGLLDASAPECASAFSDLGLATGPTSLDLPLLRLYKAGKIVEQRPLGEEEARSEVRRKRVEERRRQRAEKAKKREREEAEESESGSDDGDDESENEREVEQERALSRYNWDMSAAAIERTFKLRERSRLPNPPPPS
ncbi:hypothetical protein Rhopal_006190-T1 [Rhodotorula paludigena]|uniref:Uncharacterized protein n=1 Tax=Rhodotorula paludigena TaxID=86838 RepID=A0AAV5GX82_9BASI|nr:hypothetical protein Rhopal_006190-T1 [Rhodotorula paludigena]